MECKYYHSDDLLGSIVRRALNANLLQRTETQRGGDFIFYLQGNMSETPWAILKKLGIEVSTIQQFLASNHFALKVDHHQGLESILMLAGSFFTGSDKSLAIVCGPAIRPLMRL